jgi:transcription-repair coupling factor (superfamily II helicase)
VPYRVDLFDDEIDSIRTFDPDSQRSLYPVPEVRLLPGREFPMDEEARAKFRSAGASCWRATHAQPHLQGHGQRRGHGRHRVLPAAVLRRDGHRLRLPGRRRHLVLHGDLEPAFQRFWQDTASATAWCRATPSARLPPETLFLTPTSSTPAPSPAGLAPGWKMWPTAPLPAAADLAVVRGAEDPLARLQAISPSGTPRAAAGRKRRPARKPAGLSARLASTRRPSIRWPSSRPTTAKGGHRHLRLAQGFAWTEEGIDFVTETELFAPAAARAGARSRSRSAMSRR